MTEKNDLSITLYEEERENSGIRIIARFHRHKLSIEGYDFGGSVEEALGDWDYEYFMFIKNNSLQSLFNALGIHSTSMLDLLNKLYDDFHGRDCFKNIKAFLVKHNIEFESSYWI